MSRLLLVLFAILAIFSAGGSASSMRCPQNQVWDECGTACPLTCDQPDPRPCTLQCIIGCRCEEGLLLNNEGRCVPRSECC